MNVDGPDRYRLDERPALSSKPLGYIWGVEVEWCIPLPQWLVANAAVFSDDGPLDDIKLGDIALAMPSWYNLGPLDDFAEAWFGLGFLELPVESIFI